MTCILIILLSFLSCLEMNATPVLQSYQDGVKTDPSSFNGGLNFFAFCNDNPINATDPFGLGAQGDNSGASWLASGFQQTQEQIAQLTDAYNAISPEEHASALLNMVPVVGGLKMIGEAAWGSDFVTGQNIDNTLSYAALGGISVALSLGGPEDSFLSEAGNIASTEATATSATQLEFPFTPQVEQYALTAADSGFYPVMVRGYSQPQFITYLEQGDVWKFGTTANPGTRYSTSYLAHISQINFTC